MNRSSLQLIPGQSLQDCQAWVLAPLLQLQRAAKLASTAFKCSYRALKKIYPGLKVGRVLASFACPRTKTPTPKNLKDEPNT
jgi:hypothetical protein